MILMLRRERFELRLVRKISRDGPPRQIGLHSHSLGLSNSVERRSSMIRGGNIPLPLSVGSHILITVEAYFVSWHLFLDYWTSECRSY